MTDNESSGPLESVASSPADEVKALKEKIKELEDRERKLVQQREEHEVEFGQKRAKFKDIYLQKEEELKKERDEKTSALSEVEKLEKELSKLNTELGDIKTAVAYSESNKQDEIESIRMQCQQEVASLQHLLKEVANEASRSTAVQYENERHKLQELNEKYEEEVLELRSKLSQEREGFLSSVAKHLKQIAPGSSASSTLAQEHESLEDDMRKAQADAEVLKSVVMPLEEEICNLKAQLKEAHNKLENGNKLGDDAGASPSPSQKQMTPETQSLPDLDQARDPEERIKELLGYLRAEKASRKDLEMYVAVLSTQKNVIQDEADKVKTDLDEVCRILDEEKKAHEDLRQTWEMANDQFLESQRLMMMDMRRMETVLSAEQQRQIAEMQQKDIEREAQEKKVKGLEEMRVKQQKDQEERRRLEAMKRVEEASEKLSTRKDQTPSKLKKAQSEAQAVNENEDTEDLFNSSLPRKSPSLDTLDRTQEGDSFLDSQMEGNYEEGLRIQISPEKTIHMPYLSEAQMKAITDPTPELEARKSLLASAKKTDNRISMEGRRLVSDNEWELLQQQLKEAREKLGRPCDMCDNYEAQLQNVQDELKKEQVKALSLERQLNTERQVSENKEKYVTELENNLKNSAEEANKQISNLLNRVQECEKYMNELRHQYTNSQIDLQDNLKVFTKEREEIQKELTKLQEENDSLMGKHSKHAQQLQNEDINLPNNLEEMQLLLLKYREEIIQAKVAKEHIEENLKSELMFQKDRVQAEQQEKVTLEETLSHDISSLQEKLVLQDSLKSELERETTLRAETETKLRETDQSLKSIQAKSKQLIAALQQQVEEQSNARTKLESDVQHMKGKIQSLQVDLDNSEAVQRDFVKLSQSLQIQLEKIRQAENEVRWQHEEDVEECSNCKNQFSVTKRKHHCRHCGKIFCSDCVSKTVNSGPNSRSSRVCDICHTILVKDAMPYFSSEPPNTPD